LPTYTVSQLARLARVSVRTLHHYDHIGLLRASARTTAGYRLYGHNDLLRLQQILFFKELDLPLKEIRSILDDPEFDRVVALEQHRRLLEQQANRLSTLLGTIDKTLQELQEDQMRLTDAELYEGFSKDQIERYKREARELYDPELVGESERRIGKMSKVEWEAIQAEGETISLGLAALMDREPGDPEVQALIARHHAWIENFYPAGADVYMGLGDLYTSHPEFRAFYEKYAPGLADFLQAGMDYYAVHNLA
jgi:DNA-binding transcriptional MerR regulator